MSYYLFLCVSITTIQKDLLFAQQLIRKQLITQLIFLRNVTRTLNQQSVVLSVLMNNIISEENEEKKKIWNNNMT